MESASTLIHYKLLKAELDRLLEHVEDPDLDIYSQRTILREGVKIISEKCSNTINLIEEGN
jgi:hypothetical protein